VTAVIPTRDRWPLLLRAVESVLRQDHGSMEVIVVDDGSASPPPEDPLLRDGRVRVLRNPRSLGVGAARNRAIGESDGEWLGFLDDDDVWAPSKVRRQLESAHGEANVGLVYGSALNVTWQLDPIGVYPALDAATALPRLLEHNHVPAGASNILARRTAVREVRGFDEKLPKLTDWDLWIRVLTISDAATVPDVVVAYVQHAQAMSTTDCGPLLDEYARFRRKHAALAQRLGIRVSARAFLSWAVGRQRSVSRSAAARCSLAGGVRFREPRSLARGAGMLLLPPALGDGLSARRGRAPGGRPRETPDWLVHYRPNGVDGV